ncbi:LysR family transcriptional regulator [Paraburkholderia fungorum]|uniref:LysR family transcriptional regulator n=1 Tax=Paraburkholderia fungorum TaxID=134537 RepID=UPI0038B78D15
MSELDLNSLRLFYQVVNAGSITRAAEQLRTPKSTISRRLTLLEHSMGATLLRKGSRKLVPTDIGAVLYKHCERMVAAVENAGLDAMEMQSELRGTLRISIPVDFGISWIGRALAEFARRYEEIDLEVEVNSRAIDPREDPYDLAIQLGQLRESGVTYRRLATITRGVYGSPEYLARRGLPRTVDDFHNHRCITTDQQRQDGVWAFRNHEKQRFVEVESKIVVNNIGIARELALGGAGLSMLPNIMCTNDVNGNRLVRVLTDWESPSMTASALILNRKGITRKTRVFLDFISEKLSDN